MNYVEQVRHAQMHECQNDNAGPSLITLICIHIILIGRNIFNLIHLIFLNSSSPGYDNF